MEDITTENQPSLRRSLRIKKSNPKYMQADFADAVSLSLCVRDRERKHSVMLGLGLECGISFMWCGAGKTEGRGTV